MKKRYILIPLLGLSLVLLDCASARIVKSRPGEGGTIAITKGMSGEDEARMKADKIMASTCGEKKVKVVQEGEVVVGVQTDMKQDTNFKSNQNQNFNKTNTTGNVSTQQTATTRNITEWQIDFACTK